MEFFETQSRALEQFLYVHRVYFDHQKTGEDGMNTWYYHKDSYLTHLLEEWKVVMSRNRMTVNENAWRGARRI